MFDPGVDRHANTRDRKREKAIRGKLMRGNRDLFETQQAAERRNKRIIERSRERTRDDV